MVLKNIKHFKIYAALLISILFILTIFSIINLLKNKNLKEQLSTPSNPTYNQVINSKIITSPDQEYFQSKYKSAEIQWQGKISGAYSQVTGIKFCVIDEEHQSVNRNEPCDWFWAFSDELKDANNLSVNPNWDGSWVNYILKYYSIPLDQNYNYMEDTYTITGRVYGIDCGIGDRCAPDIDVTNIYKN